MTNQINHKTKELYTNTNAYILETVYDDNKDIKGYSNEWLTFVQAKTLNKQIIKGSKGITLSRVIDVINKQGKKEQRITHFTVFNTAQTKDAE